jgi:hypothetical protein
MGGLFKGPDMSAQIAMQQKAMAQQEAMLKKQEQQLAQQEQDRMEQLQARRKAASRGGRAMLLSPLREDAESGLPPLKEQLGE